MVDNNTDQPEEILEDVPEEVEETEEPQDEEPEEPQEEDSEPVVRDKKTDWRAAYFKEKQAKQQDDSGDDPVRRAIREELEPIRRSYQQQADEQELKQTLEKYPEAKSLEKTIRKYMASDAYQNVPVDFIARALIADRSSKKAEADNEAKATRTGGHSRRPTSAPKLPDFSKMSDEEFAEWERKNNR